jgi:hypothetical protein
MLKMAKEMFKGCDPLFKEHMSNIKDLFSKSRSLQKQREKLLTEMAIVSQLLRD